MRRQPAARRRRQRHASRAASARDRAEGGAGADIFVFTATGDSRRPSRRARTARNGPPDLLADFVSGTDRIDLSAIDAIAGTAGDDAFALYRRRRLHRPGGPAPLAKRGRLGPHLRRHERRPRRGPPHRRGRDADSGEGFHPVGSPFCSRSSQRRGRALQVDLVVGISGSRIASTTAAVHAGLNSRAGRRQHRRGPGIGRRCVYVFTASHIFPGGSE